VSAVEVSADDGCGLMRAALERAAGRAWQRFAATWRPKASRRARAMVPSPLRRRPSAAGRGGAQCDSSCAHQGHVNRTRSGVSGSMPASTPVRLIVPGEAPDFFVPIHRAGTHSSSAPCHNRDLFCRVFLNTHLSFSCSAAEIGTLASVAADRVRTRTIFVMMVFPGCSQCRCAGRANVAGHVDSRWPPQMARIF
jgi:hypothetical protein